MLNLSSSKPYVKRVLRSRIHQNEKETVGSDPESTSDRNKEFHCEVCNVTHQNFDDLELCLLKHLKAIKSESSDEESREPESDDEFREPETDGDSGEQKTDNETYDSESGSIEVKQEEPEKKLIGLDISEEAAEPNSKTTEPIKEMKKLLPAIPKNLPSNSHYFCDFCGAKLSSKKYLRYHLETLHINVNQRYVCDHCDKTFRHKTHLRNHMNLHMAINPFTCPVCFKLFKTYSQLNRHKTTHSNENSIDFAKRRFGQHNAAVHWKSIFECDICNKMFGDRRTMKRHRETHNTKRSFLICDLCGTKIYRKGDLVRHFQNVHKIKIKKQLKRNLRHNSTDCDICHKSFRSYWNFERHLRIHPENAGQCFVCDICQKVFSFRYNLVRHREIHNTTHKCNDCSLKFKSQILLIEHLIEAHNVLKTIKSKDENNGVQYMCNKCPYTTSKRENFRIHIEQHDTLIYNCSHCKETFSSTRRFKRHYTLVHTKQFECDVCQKNCSSSYDLKRHRKTHDKEQPQPTLKKKHECKICSYTCQEPNKLLRHMKTHERTYDCSKCNETFVSRSNLHQHNIAVHWKTSVKCDVCQKVFSCSYDLNRHKATHSKSRPEHKEEYNCSKCPYTSERKDHLVRHVKTHENSRPGSSVLEKCSFECDICHKALGSHYDLKRHRKIHENRPVVDCNFCGKTILKDGIFRHIRQVHKIKIKTNQ